jgi:Ser-tRNA(Ala) deacylase AlaX
MNTKLLYIEDFVSLNAKANVIDVVEENEKSVVILNQTIFYPQGGGTPVADLSEIGSITIRKVTPEGQNIRVGYDIEQYISA